MPEEIPTPEQVRYYLPCSDELDLESQELCVVLGVDESEVDEVFAWGESLGDLDEASELGLLPAWIGPLD